ncbi:unnamed protein product [Porites evermanni]|uniref:C3H1-type domain-containing protein n=1 Tax=Porites evermanni TaxID=104178 RepID=A0ABN8MQZ1_9CNID|nr:unnamed protein product [Porites evermanni]
MTSRTTRNSQVPAFDAMISPVESNPSSSAANSSLPSTGSADPSATSQLPMSDQPSPAFLAAVVSAVKQALAAEQTSNLPSTPATTYDRALREHAAASNLTDWSTINVQLFNFHAAGASVRSLGELSEEFSESRGAPSSLIICKSWNRGHCVAPSSSCRSAHKCSSCFGPHRVGACRGEASSQSRPSSKRPVDASPLRSSSKSRC